MREFSDIEQEHELKVYFGDYPSGIVYFTPREFAIPLLVYHFEKWSATLVQPFVSLVRAAQLWIEQHLLLSQLVRVDQPLEVGRDFVSFKHYFPHRSTSEYGDLEEEGVELPPELGLMRATFRVIQQNVSNEPEGLLTDVLARCTLEPNWGTFYDYKEKRYIIVELEPTREEIERWSRLEEHIR